MITVEEHLDWSIYLSKKWKYLVFKELPEKRKRCYKLPMAPANNYHFEEMKNEIEILQKIDNISSENKKQIKQALSNKNNKSYFERTWKEHPYNKFFKFWKVSPNFVKNV